MDIRVCELTLPRCYRRIARYEFIIQVPIINSIVLMFSWSIDNISIKITIITRIDHRIATVQSNLTFMVSFERGNSYLSNDCWIDNFEQKDGKLRLN